MLLSIKNLVVHYQKVAALRDVSMQVREGDIVTLIGNNGAGKTTCLHAISGIKRLTSGEIWLDDRRIDSMRPEAINKLGVSHIPEGRRVFPQMSVRENLEMGAYSRSDRAGIQRDLELVYEHFPVLHERSKQLAGTLSGGQQQMVATGRALMSGPRLLLMDEPSLGLSPQMAAEIAGIIREIHKEGRTIVLVEQNARLALALAQQGYVLETGRILISGDAADLLQDEGVKQSYLGIS